MKDDNVFKAATGLHGGFGGRGDICGSLLGAGLMMGLKLASGPEKIPEPGPPGKDVTTDLVGDLYKWYKKEFGSVKCRIVRGKYEKEVEAEAGDRKLTKMEKIDRVHSRCDKLTGKTAARAVEMICDAIEQEEKKQEKKK